MKKLIENIGIETAFAGLFGLIAIVAVFFEMAIARDLMLHQLPEE